MMNKILIIDDEPHVAWAVKMALETNDYQVVIANDGESGLIRMAEEDPDLVILDVLMPGMNGFDVLKKMREEPNAKWRPVIMLTALGAPKDVVKGYEFEADYYLTKPFDVSDLLKGVQTMISLIPLHRDTQ